MGIRLLNVNAVKLQAIQTEMICYCSRLRVASIWQRSTPGQKGLDGNRKESKHVYLTGDTVNLSESRASLIFVQQALNTTGCTFNCLKMYHSTSVTRSDCQF